MSKNDRQETEALLLKAFSLATPEEQARIVKVLVELLPSDAFASALRVITKDLEVSRG